MAQRRLGDAQLCGGFGEAALSRDGDKGLKVVQTTALHLWAPLISLCAILAANREDARVLNSRLQDALRLLSDGRARPMEEPENSEGPEGHQLRYDTDESSWRSPR